MLDIRELHVNVDQKAILKGLNLQVKPGEVHAIMGPNGAGKSTLGNVLVGRDGYQVQEGTVEFAGHDLLALEPEVRAQQGLFLAMQYPVEIPGVNNAYFLRSSLNAIRKARGEAPLDAMDFLALAKQTLQQVGMDSSFLQRNLNEGFSGGEKKRNEIVQLLLLQPKLVILDEIDSGVDIDALQTIAKAVNSLRSPERSFVMVTHYQRLLDLIVPDFVHVLAEGRIVKSGGKELALELEASGYQQWVTAHE